MFLTTQCSDSNHTHLLSTSSCLLSNWEDANIIKPFITQLSHISNPKNCSNSIFQKFPLHRNKHLPWFEIFTLFNRVLLKVLYKYLYLFGNIKYLTRMVRTKTWLTRPRQNFLDNGNMPERAGTLKQARTPQNIVKNNTNEKEMESMCNMGEIVEQVCGQNLCMERHDKASALKIAN